MSNGKLTHEGEILSAYGAAMVAAFQVLINCLEESDALFPMRWQSIWKWSRATKAA
jgi:hypothetical protein